MKSPATDAGAPSASPTATPAEAEKKRINQELWQACAGPLVNLPAAGTHVVYFPQGHSEQVAASMKKDANSQIPNYPNLPSKLLCLLHNVTLHADPETDEVYAQMTLQPVPSFDKEALLRSDLSMKQNRPQTEFFCKTLTASDTSTHGGFSVPRRAAEKIFPPLDFTMQPPAQELVARDLHDSVWTFRHIYRGQPKRHLLTTGWSLFISGKRLFAGDSVLFIRDEKQQLLLGIRRANRQPVNLSSSVLSSDSMHIGILAAAAHAAANNSPFTVFYNPRASPSEFVIPLAKYYKAVCSNQISLGMRFRMMFETEESGTRRYMGTITGISDVDSVRWKNSQWRNLQVGWDESTAGEGRNRVSVWEIEPVSAPFFICPTTSFFRSRQPGMPDDSSDPDNIFKRTMPWLGDDFGVKDPQTLPGLSLVQWMNMQQNLANSVQPNFLQSLSGSALQNMTGADFSRQLGSPGAQSPQPNNMLFNGHRPSQSSHLDQLQKLPGAPLNPLGPVINPQQQLNDIAQQQRQAAIMNQAMPSGQGQAHLLQAQSLVQQTPNVLQQQQPNHPLQRNLPLNMQSSLSQLQQILSQNQQQNLMASQLHSPSAQQLNLPENLQLQLLQKLHQQQQTLLAQQSGLQQPSQLTQNHDQQNQPLDVPQNFSRSLTSSQMVDVAQATSTSLPQSHVPQQLSRTDSQNNLRFSVPPQEVKPKLQNGILSEMQGNAAHSLIPNNPLATAGCSLLQGAAGGGQSGMTDENPSCSTSPSTNNCPNIVPPIMNARIHQSVPIGDETTHISAAVLSSNGLQTNSFGNNIVRDMLQKIDVKTSLSMPKSQSHGYFGQNTCHNASGTQVDYLDSSSSATSVCLSQKDVHLPHNMNHMSFNSQPSLFRDTSHEETHSDHRNGVHFDANMDNQLRVPIMHNSGMTNGLIESGKDFSHNLPSAGEMLSCYGNPKEALAELSSPMVSQSFGVPDMAFNSIDSTINDNGFMSRGAWATAPQLPRMRTYTKVYKRGAVGRTIDIMRYSGYEELKQDLARRFGIEGQLEDRQRVGWKLVYVDHENDVLLVGDDPWEEFVSCVRCIKILSPQEVQQLSLDGEFGNSVLQNQACSSSDGGNADTN